MTLPAPHLPYLLESEAQDIKLCQPKRVTSNRKGPLCLSSGEGVWQRTHLSAPPQRHNTQTHKQKCLTRIPITLQERPMELVEKELGTMSCAQLKDSIQNWLPHHLKCPHLPRVPLLLQHLPAAQHPPPLHQQPPPALHQHTDTSTHNSINITITYNKHSSQHLPQVLPHSPQPHKAASPQAPPTTHTPSLHHIPGAQSSHIRPHPSMRAPELHQGLPQLSIQPTEHIPSKGRGRFRGRNHHAHKLQPLLNNTTVLPKQCLSIAHQATLNSSRTAKRTCTV